MPIILVLVKPALIKREPGGLAMTVSIIIVIIMVILIRMAEQLLSLNI